MSEVQCTVSEWARLKIPVVPVYKLFGVVFTNFVVLLSSEVDNFATSEKWEIVTEAVTICAVSSVASSVVVNGEISVVASIADFLLR